MKTCSGLFKLVALAIAACLWFGSAAYSQTAPAAAPEKVDEFVKLLADPAVKDWLAKQVAGATPASPPAAVTPPAESGMEQSMVSSALDRVKAHLNRIATAWPNLPQKFGRIRDIMIAESADRGTGGVAVIVLFFVGVGMAFSYLVFRLTVGFRQWISALPRHTPQGRAKNLGGRFVYWLLMVGAFMLGSAGAFLLFDWPRLLREVVLAFLTAATITWALRMFVNFALLPPFLKVSHSKDMRILPMSDARAAHWARWTGILVGFFTFVVAAFSLLPRFDFERYDIFAAAVPAQLALLVLGLVAVWMRPRRQPAEGEPTPRIGHTAASWLLTAYFVLLLVTRIGGAFILFWFLVAAVALPAAIIMTHRAVNYVLRSPDPGTDAKPIPAVTLAIIDRGIRMVLILFAAFMLARLWGVDMQSMESTDPTTSLVLRAVLNALVIALAADLGWSIIKALIERKLGGGGHGDIMDADEAPLLDPREARLLTLLPIVKNIMLAVIVVMAILMILSSVGIQIGPLIAGAGVVGVAVGFGAQTVVKDVISGVFYLLDDAFRVGEYISSGKYMGTVESFSLRSIKLRHHRGSLFTIPFGELGAVQNQSRDWVMDKFNITVGYDTDLELARKLIKRIGLTLAEDPDFKPWVIEAIKMQGVQDFGEYGIVIRMKVTLRPGGAFQMKRKFFVLVRQAFKDNGITLPVPAVQVHQDEEAVAVAAATAHTTRRKKKAVAAAAEAEAAG